VVSAEGRRSRATGGIVVEATAGLASLDQARTIVMPGWRGCAERPPARLLKSTLRASEKGARFLSICSGVFVLAAARLLRGRRADALVVLPQNLNRQRQLAIFAGWA